MSDNSRDTRSEYVASLYHLLGKGDVPALLDGLDPDIEWVVPSGMPYGGTYRGREEVLHQVLARFATEWRDLAVDPDEIIGTGDIVVSLGHYRGTSADTGRAMAARFAHVWRFRDGRPIRFETIFDTHTMRAAMTN